MMTLVPRPQAPETPRGKSLPDFAEIGNLLILGRGRARMKKVAVFSLLLIAGLVGSQLLPLLPRETSSPLAGVVGVLTLVGLAFIMIHVGYEFELDKSRMRSYGWDYVVAMTAAAFPWVLSPCIFSSSCFRPGNGGTGARGKKSCSYRGSPPRRRPACSFRCSPRPG